MNRPHAALLRGLLLASFSAALLHLSAATVHPEEAGKRPGLHTPAEILKIMEDSSLTYELGVDETLAPARVESPRVLSDHMVLVKGDDGWSLSSHSLSREGKAQLDAAEEAWGKKDYEAALKGYAKLQELEPGYGHVLTLIGDVHYLMGDYARARSAFEESIKRNFADYQAHWFLADTRWKQGDKAEAIRSLTMAHLLNVNHGKLRDRLIFCREQAGRPWKDWTYEPRYAVSKDGDRVKVTAAEDWIGYAMVKAVWAFEPGYSSDMAGPDYGKHVITMEEEKEALLAMLAVNEKMKHLGKIVEDGFANELLYYEMLAPRAPEAIVLLPREVFMRLVDYVETYH